MVFTRNSTKVRKAKKTSKKQESPRVDPAPEKKKDVRKPPNKSLAKRKSIELMLRAKDREIDELRAKVELLLAKDDDDTLFELQTPEGEGEAETTIESVESHTPVRRPEKLQERQEQFETPVRKSPPKRYRRSPPGVTEFHPFRMAQALELKLSSYNGSTDVDEFVKKFEGCSEYYNWSERDRKFHLNQALEGQADRVIRDTCAGGSVSDIIITLRRHFGKSQNAELARVELRSRQRRPDETLSSYYQDLCRLQGLVFGSESNTFIDCYMRDAFVYGLCDASMRKEILREKPLPNSMLQALNVATHLEAIEALDKQTRGSDKRDDHEDHRERKRNDRIKVIETDSTSSIKNQLAEMRNALDNVRTELKRRRSHSVPCQHTNESMEESRAPRAPSLIGLSLSPPTSKASKPTSTHASHDVVPPSKPQSKPREPSPHRTEGGKVEHSQPRTPYDLTKRCHECNSSTHLRNFCPLLPTRRKQHVKHINKGKETFFSEDPDIMPSFVRAMREKGKVYLTIQAGTRLAVALLDTGCAHSICGRNVIPRTELEYTDRKMFTASGAPLPIMGETTIYFRIRGAQHTARVAVTNAVSEIILGIDWLEDNVKGWNFETGKVKIGNIWVPLTDGNTVDQHYLIIMKEDTIVPA